MACTWWRSCRPGGDGLTPASRRQGRLGRGVNDPEARELRAAHRSRTCTPLTAAKVTPVKEAPAMFDSLPDRTLRAAHDAARLLYDNHRALGLDPLAIKLDTLRVDITVELENRGKPIDLKSGECPQVTTAVNTAEAKAPERPKTRTIT